MVGSFILEMATRLSAERGNSVALPMSRYDIADYLAVSVETVSRALTDLKHRGVIKLLGTRVVRIVDRNALGRGRAPRLEHSPDAAAIQCIASGCLRAGGGKARSRSARSCEVSRTSSATRRAGLLARGIAQGCRDATARSPWWRSTRPCSIGE
jgi:Crp-like helix-turn-helix domain